MTDVLLIISYILGSCIILLVCKSFTVIFHEFGHAIPALLITKEKVLVYIGTYGEKEKSFKTELGRLVVYLSKNPFKWWMKGMCHPQQKTISINTQIIYTICGPFASIFIAVICSIFAFNFEITVIPRLFFIMFAGASILDLMQNLTPNDRAVPLDNGNVTYNDGYTLIRLLNYKRFPKEYQESIDFYHKKNFKKASAILDLIITKGTKNIEIYRLAASSDGQAKLFESAKRKIDFVLNSGKANAQDFSISGYIYDQIGEIERSLELYNESVYLNSNDKTSLNNLGYAYLKLHRYKEALPYLRKATSLDPQFAYAFNNLGLAKIKTNDLEGGLSDIKLGLSLNKDNAYSYRNLGVYYLEKKDANHALLNFKKAKELDPETDLINELIKEAKEKLTV